MEKLRGLFLPVEFVEPDVIETPVPTTYSVSPLTEKNLKDVLHLNLRCFNLGENYTKDTFTHLLTAPNILGYRIVTAEKRMVGFIFIAITNKSVGHITTVGVAPEHRKKGLATKLLEHAEKALRARDFDSVVLEVRVSNYVAQNLYHRHGYTIIQKLTDYYSNHEDAYLMSKPL